MYATAPTSFVIGGIHVRKTLIDLAINEEPAASRRYVVITIPKKQDIATFKRDHHGKDVRVDLDAALAQR